MSQKRVANPHFPLNLEIPVSSKWLVFLSMWLTSQHLMLIMQPYLFFRTPVTKLLLNEKQLPEAYTSTLFWLPWYDFLIVYSWILKLKEPPNNGSKHNNQTVQARWVLTCNLPEPIKMITHIQLISFSGWSSFISFVVDSQVFVENFGESWVLPS